MAPTSPPPVHAEWSGRAFSEDGIEDGGGLKVENVTPTFTFVIVRIHTYEMLDAWMDLIKTNHSEMLFQGQDRPQQSGSCTMFISYLSCNHDDVYDPDSIAMVGISYINSELMLVTGTMNMSETYKGLKSDCEIASFVHLIAHHTPQAMQVNHPMYFIFMASFTWSNALHESLIRHGVRFSRCKAYTLSRVFDMHRDKTCNCWLKCDNWNDADSMTYKLPHLWIQDKDYGEINIPWLTGYAFDVVQEFWVIHDTDFAAEFKRNRTFTHADTDADNEFFSAFQDPSDNLATNQLDRTAPASFIAPAVGSGIIVVDFQHFRSVVPGGPGSPSALPPP